MNPSQTDRSILPLPLPQCPTTRLSIFAVRRMATHGLRDAHAAHRVVGVLGLRFRMPLALLRAFVLELSRHSRKSIMIAPCCAARMTGDEGLIVDVLQNAGAAPASAARALRLLADTADTGPVLSVAAALGDCLGQLGWPMADQSPIEPSA